MLNQLNDADLGKALQLSPVGIAVSDGQETITWVNDEFQNELGIASDEICGKKISDLPSVLQPLFTTSDMIHIPANTIRGEQWYKCRQENLSSSTIHYFTNHSSEQALVVEREALKNELREALAVDEITGMPNKISMFQKLDPQISRSRRYNNLLSIIIMRVKNLEQLDKVQLADVLIPISQLLNDQVRWADSVGKISDSDFLLILPETPGDACDNLCKNLGEKIAELPEAESAPDGYKPDISFGYAEWTKGDDLVLFMNKARAMLGK